MNSHQNSSELEDLVVKVSRRLVQVYKPAGLLIEHPNSPIKDISDMQLEHALALQEQVQELELESEAA